MRQRKKKENRKGYEYVLKGSCNSKNFQYHALML